MKIGAELLKVLNKIYPPSEMIQQRFGRYDIAFKTDEQGRAALLFIGKVNESGQIKGDRFVRNLQTDQEGKIVKDHWDHKGKAS